MAILRFKLLLNRFEFQPIEMIRIVEYEENGVKVAKRRPKIAQILYFFNFSKFKRTQTEKKKSKAMVFFAVFLC